MADFSAPRRRSTPESIVPMINVVFLLLVFFLMTSQIAPPDPVEVKPPTAAAGEEDPGTAALYLSADGELAFGEARGAAALAAFARAAGPTDEPLRLRADARAEAATVAKVLRDLAAAGLRDVALVVAPE